MRVIDPLVAKIRDVQQAINAAQVNKGAIIGDVLDHALDNLAFMQGLDKAAALLGAGFFQDGPARNHDVATAAIHFEDLRSEEHTSGLQSLMRISYDVFCLTKKTNYPNLSTTPSHT